jgi:hypothetical protein
MTQYLYLGLSVEQVIERVQQGQFQLFDQKGGTRTAKQRFVPVAAAHGGTLAKIAPAVHDSTFAGVRI